jgi:hypothetical protein
MSRRVSSFEFNRMAREAREKSLARVAAEREEELRKIKAQVPDPLFDDLDFELDEEPTLTPKEPTPLTPEEPTLAPDEPTPLAPEESEKPVQWGDLVANYIAVMGMGSSGFRVDRIYNGAKRFRLTAKFRVAPSDDAPTEITLFRAMLTNPPNQGVIALRIGPEGINIHSRDDATSGDVVHAPATFAPNTWYSITWECNDEEDHTVLVDSEEVLRDSTMVFDEPTYASFELGTPLEGSVTKGTMDVDSFTVVAEEEVDTFSFPDKSLQSTQGTASLVSAGDPAPELFEEL